MKLQGNRKVTAHFYNSPFCFRFRLRFGSFAFCFFIFAFHLWVVATSTVYKTNPRTADDLQAAITIFVQSILNEQLIAALRNKLERVQLCSMPMDRYPIRLSFWISSSASIAVVIHNKYKQM